MSRQMKIAVIGAGPMGVRHLQAALSIGGTVAGVADLDRTRLANAAEQLALSPEVLFDDVRAMLAAAAPDCVVIATTAPAHCELTVLAAEAGVRTILCEKPMATSVAECDRMLEACARNGARLAVNHQLRVLPVYAEAKRRLASNELGGVASINVTGGNFGLAMIGTHLFELLRFITDEEPSSVNAWFSAERVANPRGPQFEDRAGSCRVETVGGKRLYIDAGADQGHGLKVLFGARFGQVLVDPIDASIEWWCRRPEDRELPLTRYATPAVTGTAAAGKSGPVEASAAVLRALFAGGDYPTGADGRLALLTLVACHLSAEAGGATVTLQQAEEARERRFPWA